MKFGPIPVAGAEGAILAHSETVAGRKLAKGRVLTAADIAALAAAGIAEVWTARPDPGDVTEDAAAARLAEAFAGGAAGLRIGRAATGRVNLSAEGPGLVALDAAAIDAANRVDPGITIATVPQLARLGPGGMAATIKIIPFAVPGAALDRACAASAGAIRLCPPRLRSVTLIETRTGAATPPDKGRRATAARLDRLGAALTPRVVVPHSVDAIAAALAEAPGEALLILTGSATSDAADTAPEAVRDAGGAVLHYGMPVDPGNLLFLGDLGGKPVIGLPGCARSSALNGADWVLERVICGVPVGPAEIMGMGVGGLLKEIPTRPRPRQLARRGGALDTLASTDP